MNRREFLQTGAAAFPAASLAFSASAFAAERAIAELYTVIVDDRFPEAVAFVAEARRLGVRVATVQADITDIWYRDLYYRWRESPLAIAGLTTNRSLYCLDVFGRDAGLRVVYHADHRRLAGGGVEHEVSGVERARAMAVLADAGHNWSAAAAKLVLHLPSGGRRPAGKVADLLISRNALEPLVSWAIAPVERG